MPDLSSQPVSEAASAAARLSDLAAVVMARCDQLAFCSDQAGRIQRTFLSPAMEQCHHLARSWMQAAGMDVSVDAVGNLRGVLECGKQDAPRLLFGSHLDTVPDAGRYDGILGVMMGIALVEAVRNDALPCSIEVIGFSDEEGVRFGLPFIGSRAIVGQLSAANLALADADGISLQSALEEYAGSHRDAIPATLHPSSRAYVEFHIEQGPVLEAAQQSLAVVTSIAGQTRATLTFRGKAAHAGTTPMPLRRDALAAAAEWLVAVEALAAATPGVVATTGSLRCEPGAANTIPGMVHCTLDVRAADDPLRTASMQAMLRLAQEVTMRRGLEVKHTIEADQPSTALDSGLTAVLADAVRADLPEGQAVSLMASGAGHDPMMLAPHLPSAMIFLRSPGGISHHPDEAVLLEDVAAALQAGLRLLHSFSTWPDNSR